MWSREFRAGIWFVVVSLFLGSAFRSYRREHEVRFEDLIASLESSAIDQAVDDSTSLPGIETPAALPARGTAITSSDRRPFRQMPRPDSIDPNRATAEELETLPGIGPALARRIVADRGERGPFDNMDALLRVPGIGRRTLERVRPFLVSPGRPDSTR